MMTRHARERGRERDIPDDVVELVLEYGRRSFTRGAAIYCVGRKEVERFGEVDLSTANGVHVVVARCGRILTVYRNHDLSGIRPGYGRGRHSRK